MGMRITALLAFFAGAAASLLLSSRPATSGPGAAAFVEVIARSDPSVVHVTTRMEGDRLPQSRDDAVGAGFVLRPDGWIVTSAHVLQGAQAVFADVAGRGVVEARVVATDPATDVALLRVGLEGLRPMPIGDPSSLRKGEWVLAAGSPFRLPRSWSVGIVSGLGRSGVGVRLNGYEDFIQTDAAANVGTSGGPLMTARGDAVGMMTAILSRSGRSEGVGLAVPIDVVVQTAERLMTGQAPSRPSLGVVVREVGGALQVTRFLPASAGLAAGLLAGDRILQVDGVATPRTADLTRVLWAKSAGESIVVIFDRGGRRLQTTVRLP